jgi:hypothetical protein
VREVARHHADPRRLEHDFPGFGAMARDLREAQKSVQ